MKIHIKNMVCDRCILVVRSVLKDMDITPESIILGEVTLDTPLSEQQIGDISQRIEALGFEIINDKKSRQIEAIKALIIERMGKDQSLHHVNLSEYLHQRMHCDYNYLSTLFSTVEGITIEQYQIKQKIEKVKELLVYEELTLTQISDQLGYSSVAHLSRQFKKITGLTPSHFKQLKDGHQRVPLDKV